MNVNEFWMTECLLTFLPGIAVGEIAVRIGNSLITVRKAGGDSLAESYANFPESQEAQAVNVQHREAEPAGKKENILQSWIFIVPSEMTRVRVGSSRSRLLLCPVFFFKFLRPQNKLYNRIVQRVLPEQSGPAPRGTRLPAISRLVNASMTAHRPRRRPDSSGVVYHTTSSVPRHMGGSRVMWSGFVSAQPRK
jgi:predicted PurR-regulated permease PerM